MIRFSYRKTLESGFSLIEVLVVVGLMGIVALGTATMISNMTKASKGVQFVTEVTALTQELRGTISNITSCETTFGRLRVGGPLDPNVTTAVSLIAIAGSTTTYDTAPTSLYGNRTVHIDAIEFGAPGTYLGPHPSPSPFQTRMRLRYSTPADVVGTSNVMRDVMVFVRTDAAGRVDSCSTGSLSPFVAELLQPNGYVMFPNGLMMQWGRASANANGQTTIPFNVPFPNQAFSVTVSGTNDNGDNAQDNWPTVYRNTMTRNAFVVHSADDQADPITWIAFGN